MEDPRLQKGAYIRIAVGNDLYRVVDIEDVTEAFVTVTLVWLEHAVTECVRRVSPARVLTDFVLVRESPAQAVPAPA